jgi:citronellol/citronellal dehydrogenase
MSLSGKTVFLTGGSRGIGLAIAKRFAQDGANIIIAAKTVEPHPKLGGTIHTAAAEIEELGGQALPVQTDIRYEEQIAEAIKQGVERFHGIDIVINNASAIYLLSPEILKMKQYDLMFSINARGSYMTNSLCFEYLKKSDNPHIITLSPPINMKMEWFKSNMAYTQSKFMMSMNTVGFASVFKKYGIAVNSLWPKTVIDTDAIRHINPDLVRYSRKDTIMADAAYWIANQKAKKYTGRFFIDQEVLEKTGVEDFTKYAVSPGNTLIRDLFIGHPNDAMKMLDVHGKEIDPYEDDV